MTPSRTSITVQRSLHCVGHLRAWRLLGLVVAGLVCLLAGTPVQARIPARLIARSAAQAAPGSGATLQPSTPGFEYIGGLGGAITTVAISDTLAYAGQGAQLSILDMSAPAPRVPLGTLPLTTTLTDIQVIGRRAYAVGAQLDLLVLDIGDPARPTLLGSYDTPGTAQQVQLAGDRAYLAAGTSGLLILDIGDPAHPIVLGSYAAPSEIVDAHVVGDRAYAVDRDKGLLILDISNLAAPIKLGGYTPFSAARRVEVVGDRAYLTEAYGLGVLDISDPAKVKRLGGYPTYAEDALLVVGTYVYFSASGSLLILDAGTPTSPVLLGSFYQFGGPLDLDVVGDRAYLATGAEGLRVMDVSNPAAPALVDSYQTSTMATGVEVAGDRAYVLDEAGLLIVDARAPKRPAVVGEYDVEGRDIEVVGDLAYVAGVVQTASSRADFHILDVADSAAPQLRGSYNVTSAYDPANALDVVDDRAYIVNGGWRDGGLRVLDIADPVMPELLSYTQQPFAGNVRIIGNRAYIGCGQGFGNSGGLFIVDVSDPEASAVLGSYPISDSDALLQVDDGRAYIATSEYGLQILDVGDPAHPALIGGYGAVAPRDLQIVDGIAYVAAGEHGLLLLDVRDPAQPALLASYDTPGSATSLRVAGDLVYIADGPAGLLILRVRPDLFVASGTVGGAGGRFANVDGSVALTFPPGALTTTLTFSYTGLPAPAPLPEADQLALHAFALEARGDDGAPVTTFTQPYTLELTYTNAQLNRELVDEAALAAVAWDGQRWVELLPCAGCGLDTAGNRVTIVADHLGTFALIGKQRRLFLPLTLR
jgi:hypothetical protein